LAKRRKKCPFCGVEVKKENLDRHLHKVHSDLKKKDFEKKGLKKPVGAMGKKKTQKEGKKGFRKRKPKKKDMVSAAIPIITLIIIVSLVGAIIYINLSQNEEPNGEITNNGNGGGKFNATMTTTLGPIKIELDKDRAPVTAGNFIDLANSGFFNGLIFHRVEADFVIQGGGFTADGNYKDAGSIPWENTGHQNRRYTIAMARTGDANSKIDSGTATSQFFINTVDNPDLDNYAYPYVVFGRVIKGFKVVDAIEALPTETHDGMENWPVDPPVITSVVIED
jgi:cyclophilin family peptidyl-prolyl cis-trans isomerase